MIGDVLRALLGLTAEGVSFSGAAIVVVVLLLGAVSGALVAVWRNNQKLNTDLIAAKDAHIKATETVLSESTLAIKANSGAIARLDEHIEASKGFMEDGASRSVQEHNQLLQSIQQGQAQAEQRHAKLLELIIEQERRSRQ